MLRLTLAIAFLATFGWIAVIVINKVTGGNKTEEKQTSKKQKPKTK